MRCHLYTWIVCVWSWWGAFNSVQWSLLAWCNAQNCSRSVIVVSLIKRIILVTKALILLIVNCNTYRQSIQLFSSFRWVQQRWESDLVAPNQGTKSSHGDCSKLLATIYLLISHQHDISSRSILVLYNKKMAICKFFASGSCRNGSSCTFEHISPQNKWGSNTQAAAGTSKYK